MMADGVCGEGAVTGNEMKQRGILEIGWLWVVVFKRLAFVL
jgi:hypothetical protein